MVLIIEDHAYGMIRWKQAVDGFPDFGLSFGNPDFVALRRGLRRAGPRVRGVGLAAGPGAGLFRRRACISSSFPVDYSENIRVLVDELRHMQH